MDALDEKIRNLLKDRELERGLGARTKDVPSAEEFHLFIENKLEGGRLENILSFLKDNPEWREWVIQARALLGESDKTAEGAKVPQELIEKVKSKISGTSANSAPCPHCGKAITPFKKPVSKQRVQVVLWAAGAALSFAVSFFVPRYFFQFLVLTVLLGVKAIVDHRAAKTQILIYKALEQEKGGPAPINRLHQNAPHL